MRTADLHGTIRVRASLPSGRPKFERNTTMESLDIQSIAGIDAGASLCENSVSALRRPEKVREIAIVELPGSYAAVRDSDAAQDDYQRKHARASAAARERIQAYENELIAYHAALKASSRRDEAGARRAAAHRNLYLSVRRRAILPTIALAVLAIAAYAAWRRPASATSTLTSSRSVSQSATSSTRYPVIHSVADDDD